MSSYKMAVHKVKEIETWANYFENTNKHMKWTPKMMVKAGFWTLVVPYVLFKAALPTHEWQEKYQGRNVTDVASGAEVFTEYGTGGGPKKTKYTSF